MEGPELKNIDVRKTQLSFQERRKFEVPDENLLGMDEILFW